MSQATRSLPGLAPLTGRSWDKAARRPTAAIDALCALPEGPLAVAVTVNGYNLAEVLEYIMAIEARVARVDEAIASFPYANSRIIDIMEIAESPGSLSGDRLAARAAETRLTPPSRKAGRL